MTTLTHFFPSSWDERSIVQPLNATLARAHRLYGAVAYWTIGPDVLHPRLLELLRQPESFCCVDLHLPTDVDQLNAFARLGAGQLYVQCHEVRQRGERHLHRHLLHTKLLLFDLPRGQAEVWVGSYNFTKQALLGSNREAAVVIATPQGSALYQQVRGYLEALRADAHCHRFDPTRLDDYKKLQGLPDDEPEPECLVLPVAWHSDRMVTLARQTLLLLGHDADERRLLAQADATNAPLLLRAYDLATGLTTHYGVVIQNQGAIDRQVPSSYDLAFGQRHLAVRPPDTLPYVAPQENPLPPAELREFGFWASLLILDQLPTSLRLLPRERSDRATWQRDWDATRELRDQLQPTVEKGRQLVFAYDARPAPAPPTRDAIPELSAEQWLRWALESSVRYRGMGKLGPVGVFSAVFQREVPMDEQTPLDALDRQFSPYHRWALQIAYEQPLRQRYYDTGAADMDFRWTESADVPRLHKLLEKYRLQY